MIGQRIILDTGVLVALLSKSDRSHDWAVRQWSQVKPPAFTCDAVISETCFLLKRRYLIEAVFEMIAKVTNFILKIRCVTFGYIVRVKDSLGCALSRISS